MTLCGHINSVPWLYAVTPTPYHECTQFVDSVKPLSFSLNRGFFGPIAYIHGTDYGVGVTAFIHGTELMQFGKVTLRSTKISLKWLWPVKVTLKAIKRRLLVFCWSCDESPLKWDKKNSRASSLPLRIECFILSTLPPNGRSMPLMYSCVQSVFSVYAIQREITKQLLKAWKAEAY
jgi:hypothetical protein